MDTQHLKIEGVLLINNFLQKDLRGFFVKPFSNLLEPLNQLNFKINEVYYSLSGKNVIRGMHFQRPPMDHAKLIYVSKGSITDVLLDLRKSSKTYKEYIFINLKAHTHALFIPTGIAHGFLSRKNGTTVVYNQSTVYPQEHNEGILWSSFGYEWKVDKPILSERDKSLSKLDDFDSPFS